MIMQKDAGDSFKEQVFIHGSEEETGTFPQLLVHALLDEVFLRDWKASSVVLMDNDASRRKAEPLNILPSAVKLQTHTSDYTVYLLCFIYLSWIR